MLSKWYVQRGNDLQLVDHIIFCVFCDSTSSALRLRNFIAPLRSAHMLRDRLKPIVIIAQDKSFLFQAWTLLSPYQPLFFALVSDEGSAGCSTVAANLFT